MNVLALNYKLQSLLQCECNDISDARSNHVDLFDKMFQVSIILSESILSSEYYINIANMKLFAIVLIGCLF